MADFKSHSRIEHDLAPHFRERLNHAESGEDVKKFFAYTMQDLLGRVLGDGKALRFDDVALDGGGTGFQASPRLSKVPAYSRALADSDLGAIMTRFAESAQHRLRHLETRPQKTNTSVRGRQGQ